MQIKEEMNALDGRELSEEELANVAGGACGDSDDSDNSGGGPVETRGNWALCNGSYYNSCGYDRANYSEGFCACGNCTRFTPNSPDEWYGPGICSGN